jgi:REP element-mobilizing transposase RayT
VIFATAERRPFIRDEIRERLHGYLSGIARENGIPVLAVGGIADHVHLLISLTRTISVAKAVQLLKSGSSKWIHESFPGSRTFAWQEGYGAFSVGVSQKATTVKYILAQVEHHKRISFEDELKKFLSVHGINEDFSRPFGTGRNSLGLPRTASLAKFPSLRDSIIFGDEGTRGRSTADSSHAAF